jgi:hypothetical protein
LKKITSLRKDTKLKRHTHAHTHTHPHTHTCTHTHMYTHTHVHTHMYTHIYTLTQADRQTDRQTSKAADRQDTRRNGQLPKSPYQKLKMYCHLPKSQPVLWLIKKSTKTLKDQWVLVNFLVS